jgi:integrase/recombinase XerD
LDAKRVSDFGCEVDIQLKEKAMARTRPVKTPSGRYCPDDKLLAFLEAF